jgi:hypothetical protein
MFYIENCFDFALLFHMEIENDANCAQNTQKPKKHKKHLLNSHQNTDIENSLIQISDIELGVGLRRSL